MKLNKPSIRSRLKALEMMAHPPIMSPERIEVIEKSIQEIYDKLETFEKELLEPLRKLRSESNSDS
tara:strand:- start:11711 stop:11908 length:198 start_codon:yes stop_codon:yes gene_type:complete